MLTTRSQGEQDGQLPPEKGPPPEVPQLTHKEIQLEERNHVFEVLNLNDDAIGVMNLQNITSVLRIISTKRNIYDGLASAHRGHWMSTDSEQITLFKLWLGKLRDDNDNALPTDWVQGFTYESFLCLCHQQCH